LAVARTRDGCRPHDHWYFPIATGHAHIGFTHVTHEQALADKIKREDLGAPSRRLQGVQEHGGCSRDQVPLASKPDAIGHQAAGRHKRQRRRSFVITECHELVGYRIQAAIANHAAQGQLGPCRDFQISVRHVGSHSVIVPVLGDERRNIRGTRCGGPLDVVLNREMHPRTTEGGREMRRVDGKISHARKRITEHPDPGRVEPANRGGGSKEVTEFCQALWIIRGTGDIVESDAGASQHTRQILGSVHAVVVDHIGNRKGLIHRQQLLCVPDDDG